MNVSLELSVDARLKRLERAEALRLRAAVSRLEPMQRQKDARERVKALAAAYEELQAKWAGMEPADYYEEGVAFLENWKAANAACTEALEALDAVDAPMIESLAALAREFGYVE